MKPKTKVKVKTNFLIQAKETWDEVENAFKEIEENKKKGWKYYPAIYCENEKPDNNDLKKIFQLGSSTEKMSDEDDDEDDNWKQSTHPWCKSCYGLYSQVCNSISYMLNIKNKDKINTWKEGDLSRKIKEFKNEVIKKWSVEQMLEHLTPLFKALTDCIQARWYHHKSCWFFQGKPEDTVVANREHMKFVTQLCKNLFELKKVYTTAFELYKISNPESKEVPIYEKVNKSVLYICRHQLKNFGSNEHKKTVHRVFSTKTRRAQGPFKKSNITKKSKKKAFKQSRIKNAYRISKKRIKSLIKEYVK
jgi:hypothetical protein